MRVFVTSHGQHFHRWGRHLFTGSGMVAADVGRALMMGYKPCSHCFPPPPRGGRDGSDAYLTLSREETA